MPLIGENYDYNNSILLKVRQEIDDKVKKQVSPDDYKKNKKKIKKKRRKK